MRVLLIPTLFFLFGCQHNESDDKLSPLVGKWLTDACAQVAGAMDEPLSLWAKGIYRFHESKAITLQIKTYEDSSCSGTFSLSESTDESVSPFEYLDLGKVILQEGIEGREILILLEYDDIYIEIDGFYTINDGSLCFSDNINMEPRRIGFSDFESVAIDFEHCLTKISEF